MSRTYRRHRHAVIDSDDIVAGGWVISKHHHNWALALYGYVSLNPPFRGIHPSRNEGIWDYGIVDNWKIGLYRPFRPYVLNYRCRGSARKNKAFTARSTRRKVRALLQTGQYDKLPFSKYQ